MDATGATNLAELYGLPLVDWARIEARLEAGLSQAPGTGGPDRHTCWLATINDALGAQPDALLAQALPAEVRETVTYGRPVAG